MYNIYIYIYHLFVEGKGDPLHKCCGSNIDMLLFEVTSWATRTKLVFLILCQSPSQSPVTSHELHRQMSHETLMARTSPTRMPASARRC